MKHILLAITILALVFFVDRQLNTFANETRLANHKANYCRYLRLHPKEAVELQERGPWHWQNFSPSDCGVSVFDDLNKQYGRVR